MNLKEQGENRMINYMLVSERAILRDYVDTLDYMNDEHKMLVDIADFFYNNNLGAEYLLPEAKEVYDRYGKEYWGLVLNDMGAMDDQIGDSTSKVNDLILDYQDLLNDERSK